jgi:hypothetical protein
MWLLVEHAVIITVVVSDHSKAKAGRVRLPIEYCIVAVATIGNNQLLALVRCAVLCQPVLSHLLLLLCDALVVTDPIMIWHRIDKPKFGSLIPFRIHSYLWAHLASIR